MDAIVIPGGGLTPEGDLPPWVLARFERALQRWNGEYLIPLSGGTTHRPLALTSSGKPQYEAHVGAEWLMGRGVPEHLLLPESLSFDTIGNAVFARLLHTDPRGLRRLHVISSGFHLPRCQAVFDWVFSLPDSDYTLTYEATPDAGMLPATLAARQAKERQSLETVEALRNRLGTKAALLDWLFREHGAYRASRPAWECEADQAWLDSY